jgi:hypothetical protein
VNGSCCCWDVSVAGGDCGVPGCVVGGSRPATNITGASWVSSSGG